MKSLTNVLVVPLIILVLPLFVLAQNEIPNPSFENWTNLNPDNWTTSNFFGIPTIINVTQSSDAYTGSWSAQLEVVSFGAFPYSAVLYSDQTFAGFPVTERYEALNGYYKYQAQTGDVLAATVIMYTNFGEVNQGVVGSGSVVDSVSSSGWETFSVPITYISQDIPDGAWIQIGLINEIEFGGIAWVDSLWFGEADVSGCCVGIRGNANGHPSDDINISDITFLTNYLFGMPAGDAPECTEEANANGHPSEDVNISDVAFLTNYLFGMPSGDPPPACP